MKGGGDIIPTTLLLPPPRIFRLSYGPVVCYAAMQFMTYLQTTSWKNCPFQVKISKSAWQTFVNVANAHVMSICMDLATQSQSCMWGILGFRINVLRPLYTLIYFLKGIQLRCTLIKKIVAYFRCFLYTYFQFKLFYMYYLLTFLAFVIWERMFNFKTYSQPDCTLI